MRNHHIAMICLIAVKMLLVCAPSSSAADYVVVDFTGANDPYHKAAKRLAELRQAEIVLAEPDQLGPLLESLQKHAPQHVAFVIRPDQFDENLARSVLLMATQIDADPFVDFAYGFITGDKPETAVSLIEKAQAAEKQRRKPELAVVAVGEKVITKSGIASQNFPLRNATVPQLWGQIAGRENFPNDGRDAKFIKTLMPQLKGKSMIVFAGHGYPREVEGGPNWNDLQGIQLDGSVVLNIACYTGVTGTWFNEDWKSGKRQKLIVAPSESFCLNILKSGVAAYVAYACARPAGPELFVDVGALATEGLTVGEVRRRDYNRVVLAYIAQGFEKLKVAHVEDGQPLRPRQNIVKDLLLDMATGGVLFGDPAFKPFPEKPGEAPVDVRSQRKEDLLTITVQVNGQNLFFECGEQLDTWGKDQEPTMRLLARAPLGQAYVKDVQIKDLKIAGESPERRLAWAVEEDRGKRFLHVKAVFPQPTAQNAAKLMAGAKAVFEATLTDDSQFANANSIVADKSGR